MASGLPLFALLVICLAASQVARAQEESATRRCPPGWTNFRYRCYMYNSRRVSWYNAKNICIAHGGNLVSIRSREENNFVSSLGEKTRTWIGGTDAAIEGFWQWVDGTFFSYTQWKFGEPSNSWGKEHCLEINYLSPDWNDAGCERLSPFICAK